MRKSLLTKCDTNQVNLRSWGLLVDLRRWGRRSSVWGLGLHRVVGCHSPGAGGAPQVHSSGFVREVHDDYRIKTQSGGIISLVSMLIMATGSSLNHWSWDRTWEVC